MSVFTEHAMVQELHRDGGKVVLLVLDGLGIFHAITLMAQAMVHAGRLKRFGA
jgi:hypothetical protein